MNFKQIEGADSSRKVSWNGENGLLIPVLVHHPLLKKVEAPGGRILVSLKKIIF